jgi:hypothetical protein
LLELRELEPGRVEVSLKTSSLRPTGAVLEVRLPDACVRDGAVSLAAGADSLTERFSARCGALEGESIGLRGLAEMRIDALLRVEFADGRLVRAVLRGTSPMHVVPHRSAPLDVARDYAWLGAEHISSGLDHLLFVFGLLLLVGGRTGRLVATITAFTVGHSVTLCLAVLGFVRVPTGLVELAIAGSVLLLAVELARPLAATPSLLRRFPWLMAGVFGLLHGLGFAASLTQAGLPAEEVPLALFAFNLGIEAGQLAFVWLALSAWHLYRLSRAPRPDWMRVAPVYGLGTLAAYWCFERSAALF